MKHKNNLIRSTMIALVVGILGTVSMVAAKRVAGAPQTGRIGVRVENKTNKEQVIEVKLSRFFGTAIPEETLLGVMRIPASTPKTSEEDNVNETFMIPAQDLNRMRSTMQNGTYVKAKMRPDAMMRIQPHLGGSTYRIIFKINGKKIGEAQSLTRTPASFRLIITEGGVEVLRAMLF